MNQYPTLLQLFLALYLIKSLIFNIILCDLLDIVGLHISKIYTFEYGKYRHNNYNYINTDNQEQYGWECI